jgi:hypothetical protein
MTLIDGDRIITAQEYDDEYEEFTEEKMSIIDFVNRYSDEGVTTADDILDKIRAEIEAKCHITVGRENDPAISLYDVFQIIDEYKTESEE